MKLALWALMTLLVGCAQRPVEPISGDQVSGISGRISITQPGRRDTGGFDYQTQQSSQRWLLSGPTGGPIGALLITGDRAQWTSSKGDVIQAKNARLLSIEALGVELPLDEAGQWMMGFAPAPDELGGWSLTYTKRDDLERPRIIDLTKDEVRVRAVIKTWQYSPN